mgnify:CR=1 FL=1
MGFLKDVGMTKTGIVGILSILASLAGFIPVVGTGLNPELLMLGVGLLTMRHTLYKQDIRQLDPVLDKLVGDKISGVSQDLLIKLLEAEEKEDGGDQ